MEIDGEKIPQEDISFGLRGEEYGIAQLHDLISVFWSIDSSMLTYGFSKKKKVKKKKIKKDEKNC